MTADQYDKALQQIAADHARLEAARRYAEALANSPAVLRREIGDELIAIVGVPE